MPATHRPAHSDECIPPLTGQKKARCQGNGLVNRSQTSAGKSCQADAWHDDQADLVAFSAVSLKPFCRGLKASWLVAAASSESFFDSSTLLCRKPLT